MSLLTYPMPVPAGQHPPFAVVTPTDHRAWIFVSAALGISLTFMSLGVRAFVRYATRVALGYDDAALMFSILLAVLQTSLILAATSKGLGESFFRVDAHQRSTLQHLYYASNLFYILSLCASRASVLIFLRRMVPNDLNRRGADVLSGILALWTLASLMALALQCNLSAPWYFAKSECTAGLFTRWAGVEITGAVLEVCIIVLTFSTLVWNLQASLRRKVRIMIAFAIRGLILILIGIRLNYFHTNAIEQDPTLSIADFVCLTQAEMNFSIISRTAPMLRVVLMSVPSKFGDTISSSIVQSRGRNGRIYGSKQRRTRGTESGIQLSSLRSFASRPEKSEPQQLHLDTDPESDMEAFVPVGYGATTSKVQEGMDAKSTNSQGSQEMIIKKNTTWAVSYDH